MEDCGYTGDQLEKEIGSKGVRELVEWVTRPDEDGGVAGKKVPWEVRNRRYLERIRNAPVEALNISCADKTANIMDMCRWLERGYKTEDFTSQDHRTQLAKFEALEPVFNAGGVAHPVYGCFKSYSQQANLTRKDF